MGLRESLTQIAGFLGIVFGTIFGTVAAYINAGGVFSLNIGGAVIEQGASALAFLVVGILILACGIVLSYFAGGRRRLNPIISILGSCALIVPSTLLGLNYDMAAGIVAIVLGWAWTYSIFVWLTK